jgi:hypothetical protein
MIAFGCIISEPEAYRRYAEPGIALARESDSRVYPFATVGTIGRSYNLLLESAAACEDLEGLVIVHPHAQLDDRDLTAKVRAAFADPEVAVLGVVGAREVRSIGWWEGSVSAGPVVQRHAEFGGGELPAFAWTDPRPAPAEVDVVDGFVLVLSPWAVRNVPFDEGLMLGHGFDVDYCLQVRAAGRRVVTLDARVIEHRELDLIEDPELWIEAHIAMSRKWGADWPGPHPAESEWERRARRAEAENEAARTVAYSHRLGYDMRLDALKAELEALTATRSWRTTRPLRALNLWRRSRAAG